MQYSSEQHGSSGGCIRRLRKCGAVRGLLGPVHRHLHGRKSPWRRLLGLAPELPARSVATGQGDHDGGADVVRGWPDPVLRANRAHLCWERRRGAGLPPAVQPVAARPGRWRRLAAGPGVHCQGQRVAEVQVYGPLPLLQHAWVWPWSALGFLLPCCQSLPRGLRHHPILAAGSDAKHPGLRRPHCGRAAFPSLGRRSGDGEGGQPGPGGVRLAEAEGRRGLLGDDLLARIFDLLPGGCHGSFPSAEVRVGAEDHRLFCGPDLAGQHPCQAAAGAAGKVLVGEVAGAALRHGCHCGRCPDLLAGWMAALARRLSAVSLHLLGRRHRPGRHGAAPASAGLAGRKSHLLLHPVPGRHGAIRGALGDAMVPGAAAQAGLVCRFAGVCIGALPFDL
mmetsp:Transcript_51084/g.122280  ORF Transcript_51084/g.122280 Transcript_51084/m.122280 type:complete len:392 (-) Transcript_51084:445-1620(-)